MDTVTLFRISALISWLMAAICWLMLGRPRQGGSGLWCVAVALVGCSVWLIGQRGQTEVFWTYCMAQTLYLGGILLLAQSLRMDMQRPWPWTGLVAGLLVYAAVLAFGFADKQAQSLALLVRLVNLAALMALTVSGFMLARHERSRNAMFMTVGYGLLTVSMLLAAWGTRQGQSNLQLMSGSVFNQILGLTSFVTLVMNAMGYLGLAVERSLHKTMVLQQAQWQEQQWRERSQDMILLDRQRTLDVLANSLGHGLIQPLTATLLNLQMARKTLQSATADKTPMAQMLDQVVEGLRRCDDMVSRIRTFLRPTPSRSQRLNLQSVVLDAESLLRQEMMYRKVAFQVLMPQSEVWVQAEALPLTQALVQVVRNALQAVQGRPTPSITVTLQTTDQEAQLVVEDSGPGFPDSMLATDASQAWSLTDVQDGLDGLGLYMTRNILASFKGQLILENRAGHGARVSLVLPIRGEVDAPQ